MNLRRRTSPEPELNITPLIDVVFLLLIFFMVSTTFDKRSEVKIELPKASADAPQQEPQALVVAIDAKGRFFVNDREVLNTRAETLRKAIAEAATERRDVPFVISADANTPHQSVITAMDAAGQLGFTHLTFAARKAEREQ